jgi:hypothetical protein
VLHPLLAERADLERLWWQRPALTQQICDVRIGANLAKPAGIFGRNRDALKFVEPIRLFFGRIGHEARGEVLPIK